MFDFWDLVNGGAEPIGAERRYGSYLVSLQTQQDIYTCSRVINFSVKIRTMEIMNFQDRDCITEREERLFTWWSLGQCETKYWTFYLIVSVPPFPPRASERWIALIKMAAICSHFSSELLQLLHRVTTGNERKSPWPKTRDCWETFNYFKISTAWKT